MSCTGIHRRRSHLHQLFRGAREPLTAADPVLEHQGDLPLDLAENRHPAAAGTGVVVHDRELGAQHLRQPRSLLRTRRGRRDDDRFAAGCDLAEPVGEHRQRGHVVDRDVEEPLNLAGVKVHGQDAVGAGVLDHVRDHPGGDRLARRRLPVLAGIEEARNDCRDPLRGGEPGGVDHHHQLDQMDVDGRDGRLDQEDVGAADGLGVAAVGIAVGERLELDPTDLRPQLRGDSLRELRVRAAGEEPQPLHRRQCTVDAAQDGFSRARRTYPRCS